MIWLAFLVVSPANAALLSVAVIHRHGDRNPLFPTYSTDPYKNDSHWPTGFGQLTNRGIRRCFDLGVWLRSRYDGFLPSCFSPKFFRAYSTDVDRTLMSGAATLAGIFPPLDSNKWHEKIHWRPVPVHTKPKSEDPVLAMKKQCPQYNKLYSDLLKSDEIREINEKNQKLFEFLSEKTRENVSSIVELELIHNTLQTQEFNNKSLPDWTRAVYPEKMRELAVFTFKLPCYTPELSRLRTGLFFNRIFSNFKKYMKSQKFLLFSAHDTTLADILTALKHDFEEIPPFSSAIIFELRMNKNSTQYVNVYYKRNDELVKVALKGCGFNCDFGGFERVLLPIMVNSTQQWEQECRHN